MDQFRILYDISRKSSLDDETMFYTSPAINTMLQHLYNPERQCFPNIKYTQRLPFKPTNLRDLVLLRLSAILKDEKASLLLWDPRKIIKAQLYDYLCFPKEQLFDFKYQGALQATNYLIDHEQYDNLSAKTLYCAHFLQSFSELPKIGEPLFKQQNKNLLDTVVKRYSRGAPSLVRCLDDSELSQFRELSSNFCFCKILERPLHQLQNTTWHMTNEQLTSNVLAHWALLFQMATKIHPSLNLATCQQDGKTHYAFWHTWLLNATKCELWAIKYTHN